MVVKIVDTTRTKHSAKLSGGPAVADQATACSRSGFHFGKGS